MKELKQYHFDSVFEEIFANEVACQEHRETDLEWR